MVSGQGAVPNTGAVPYVNPYMNPYMMNSGMYGSLDGADYMSGSLFSPYMMGGFYNNPLMNPMLMMNRTLNPASYDARQNGINPADGMYFSRPESFQAYNNQRLNLNDGLRKLHEYALSDNQDDFKKTYDDILLIEKQRIRSLQPNIDEATLDQVAKSSINESYAKLSGGRSLGQTLELSGDGAFWQGMKDSFSLGIFNDKRTVQQNIAMVNNAPENGPQRQKESALQTAGRWVAGIGLTIAGLALFRKGVGPACKGVGWFGKFLIFGK